MNIPKTYYGMKLFELCGKVPKRKGNWLNNTTSDLSVIESWTTTSAGIDLGQSDLVVIDVDNKGNKCGTDSFLDFIDDNDIDLPDTLTITTPTGGYHYYFKGTTRNRVNWLPGVDVRSRGGYVVIGGSTTDAGKYTIVNDVAIAELPSALFSSIKHSNDRAENPIELNIELDKPDNIDRAINLVKTLEPAIEGDGGDATTYKVVCAVRDMALTEATAFAILSEYWNDRCEPPWSAEDLQVKISNAYRYAISHIGSKTTDYKVAKAESIFGIIPSASTPTDGPKNWDDFRGEAPKIEWIVDNWLPLDKGLALFTGMGSSGKSYIALQLGNAITTKGGTWLGQKINHNIPVLAVLCEDPDSIIHSRKNGIEKINSGDRVQPFLVWSRLGKNNSLGSCSKLGSEKGPFYDELCSVLADMPKGPKLLILDTLSDVFSGDENNRVEASQFVKTIVGSLCKKYDATVLILAHPPKNGSQYSGSTAWQGSFRTMWFIKSKEDQPDIRVLEVVKSNYSRSGDQIFMKYADGYYANLDMSKVDEALDRVVYDAINLAYVEGNPYGKTSRSANFVGDAVIPDPVTEAPLEPACIIQHVTNLINRGEVEHIKDSSFKNRLILKPL